MNRRGFLGLLGKLVSVGTAISVHPAILAPLKAAMPPKKLTAEEACQELRKISERLKSQGVAVWTLAS
jgi:hypothetical protein